MLTYALTNSNELASCPDLRRSRRLRELQLADNCLNMISPWIKELRLLRMLDVSNNQLSDVPAELSEVRGFSPYVPVSLLPPLLQTLFAQPMSS